MQTPCYPVLFAALYANSLLYSIIHCFICKLLQAGMGEVGHEVDTDAVTALVGEAPTDSELT